MFQDLLLMLVAIVMTQSLTQFFGFFFTKIWQAKQKVLFFFFLSFYFFTEALVKTG